MRGIFVLALGVAAAGAQDLSFQAADDQGRPKLVAGTFAGGLFGDSTSLSAYTGYKNAVINDSRGPKPDANLPSGYPDSGGASSLHAVGSVSGDFNGDGRPDLLGLGAGNRVSAGNSGGVDRLTFYEGLIEEVGGYRYPPITRAFNRNFLSVAAGGDLDEDGKTDLILATDSGVAFIPGGLISCRGLCPPLLDFGVIPLPGRPVSIEPGRLNADTLVDVVVLLAGNPARVAVLLGKPSGFPDSVRFWLTAGAAANVVPGANILTNALGSGIGLSPPTRAIVFATRDSAGDHIEVFDNNLPAGFDHHSFGVVAPNGFTTDGWNMLAAFDANADGRVDVIGATRPVGTGPGSLFTSGLITFLADSAGRFGGTGAFSPSGSDLVFLPVLHGTHLNLARRVLTGGWGFNGSAGGMVAWEPDNQGRFRVIGSMRGGPLANFKSAVRWGVSWYDGVGFRDTVTAIVYADGGASGTAPGGMGTLSVSKLLQFFGAPTPIRPVRSVRRLPAGFSKPGLSVLLPDGSTVNLLGRKAALLPASRRP